MPDSNAILQDRRPVIVSGPSGVGKGTLIQRLFEAYPNVFAITVSHKTRPPRPGEAEGVDYYVSPEEFNSLISEDTMVEHAMFSGHHYGTSKQTVADQERKGRVVVLDIEMHGVQQIKANRILEARCVFVKPPSLKESEGAWEAA
ncbi:guanylate kinase [Gnomoniopsis smithogilvyi]|uniref:Guanylate kinase n=1 Tax=Gnomoniopsis smithogilvyi TaxID=1191159 RepID=A0A9W8Z4U2_9PEZI|nr:guanylate kinase [Gnomoniopsis smithogilvyi]